MSSLSHHYIACAAGTAEGRVTINADPDPTLHPRTPPTWDGEWSPETLLTAAVANGFVLSFRSAARAAGLDWLDISCRADGLLERIADGDQFTVFILDVRLRLVDRADRRVAQCCLRKSKADCRIARSIKAATRLNAQIIAGIDEQPWPTPIPARRAAGSAQHAPS